MQRSTGSAGHAAVLRLLKDERQQGGVLGEIRKIFWELGVFLESFGVYKRIFSQKNFSRFLKKKQHSI